MGLLLYKYFNSMSEDKRVKKLSTKKKFIADGVFNAELNALLQKVLSQEGYSGISVRATSMCTEIRIVAAKHDELMEKGAKRVREIKSIIEKRYNFNDEDNKVEITIKPPDFDKALCSAANVEALKFKLLTGTPVRNAVNNMMGGKVRGQRAKAQKYSMGYLISTGQPMKDFVDVSIRHVHMRQGVLGLKVKIMASLEKKVGKNVMVMPDYIKINEPKDDDVTAIVPGVQFQRQQNAAAMPDAAQ